MENVENQEQIPEAKQDEGQWKDDIRTSCMNIFCNFAKFSEEDKEFYISHQNIIKILRTVNLLESVPSSKAMLKLVEVDVMLKKVNKKAQKITGKQFMNFIVLLTAKLDPEGFAINSKVSVVKVIKTFFEPFSNFIEEKTLDQNGPDESAQSSLNSIFYHKQIENRLLTTSLDSEVLTILDSVYNGIKYIFKSYFHYEVNKYNEVEVILRQSLSNLIEFCKNFEICPFVITTNKIAIYYNLLIEMEIGELVSGREEKFIYPPNKDLGVFFTLNKFAMFLVHMACMTFDKHSNKEALDSNTHVQYERTLRESNGINMINMMKLSNSEKLIFFFERLESSKGIEFIEKKTNKPFNSLMSLIPPRTVVDKINPQIIELLYSYAFKESKKTIFLSPKNRTLSTLSFSDANSNTKAFFGDWKSSLAVKTEEALERFSQSYDVLKEIFETYSQIGDKFRNNHMSLSGYCRFLKDCNIVYTSKKTDKGVVNLVNVVNDPMKISKSILKLNSVPYSREMSTRSLHKNASNRKNVEMQGKILESDISVIFYNLTGVKNFDNSEKIKSQFNRNKGYSPNIEECLSTPNINKVAFGRKLSTKTVIPLKMNFNHFLKSFEAVAQKLHPDLNLDEAVCLFFDNNISTIIKEHSDMNFITVKKNLLEALSYLKREEIIEVLKDLNHVMLPHYLNYTNNLGLIFFDNFYQFCKDFSIFPDIVNLVQLKNIFFTLADFLKGQVETDSNFEAKLLYKSSSKVDIRMSSDIHTGAKIKDLICKEKCLNFDLFIDSLALASLHTKTHEDLSEIEKIICLADKMAQSHGVNKSQARSGETFNANKEFFSSILSIKDRFPTIYGKKRDLHEVLKSPSCFDDIFEDN